MYGAGLSAYEILELTPTSYRERLVVQLDPGFRPGLDGIHHLSTTGSSPSSTTSRANVCASLGPDRGVPRAGARLRDWRAPTCVLLRMK